MIDAKVPRFFDYPTQIAFYDEDTNNFIGGIAYQDHLMCLECGAIISIENYLNSVKDCDIPFPIIPLKWENLSEFCLGNLRINPMTGEAALP